MGILDDPRGRESGRLAFAAEQLIRTDRTAARQHYARAAALESEFLAEVPRTERRIFSALAVSAVALWFKAEERTQVIELATRLLQDAESLTADARREILGMRDDCVLFEETAAHRRVLLENFNLADAERLLCQAALHRTGSLAEAATALGITLKALKRLIVKYRIEAEAAPQSSSPRDPKDALM